jgi:hypothetical protein
LPAGGVIPVTALLIERGQQLAARIEPMGRLAVDERQRGDLPVLAVRIAADQKRIELMPQPTGVLTRRLAARRGGMRDDPRHRHERRHRPGRGSHMRHHAPHMRRVAIARRLVVALVHRRQLSGEQRMHARQVGRVIVRQ